jgi:hypothetical protein
VRHCRATCGLEMAFCHSGAASHCISLSDDGDYKGAREGCDRRCTEGLSARLLLSDKRALGRLCVPCSNKCWNA